SFPRVSRWDGKRRAALRQLAERLSAPNFWLRKTHRRHCRRPAMNSRRRMCPSRDQACGRNELSTLLRGGTHGPRIVRTLASFWTMRRPLSYLSPMDKTPFNVRSILAGEAPKDAPVTVRGWVRTRRDSKAGISFVHLSDGSAFHPVQVVAPNTLPNYADEVLR